MSVWKSVIEDMKGRDTFGQRKYGRDLNVNDGRDWLKEAYEEALDQCCYLKAAIIKRDGDARDIE